MANGEDEQTDEEIIADVAEEVDGTVRYDYSGRGMYGKSCVGIVCGNKTECIEAAARKGLKGARTDAMGRHAIVYWPKIKSKRGEMG
jgi:hypothetical protein